MAISLVGQVGSPVISATSIAPSGFTFGQITTPGNLLVAWWAGQGTTGTNPSITTSGWTQGPIAASTSVIAGTFWAIAAGNDPVPVFTAISGVQQTVLLGEFSGASLTPVDLTRGFAFGTTSGTLTFLAPDKGANDLIVTSSAGAYSVASSNTMSHAYNNGGVAQIVYNDSATVQTTHACFSWATLTTRAVADAVTCTCSTPNPVGHSAGSQTFLVGPNPNLPSRVSGTFVRRI